MLKGGLSAEREVSLRSGAAVAEALRGEGYDVTEIDAGRDVADQLARLKPEACFNALHGKFGEDGCVQGILEMLDIPYTHSGVLSSALAMHKERAKDIMKASGVPVAEARLVTRAAALEDHAIPPPYVVKPVAEGSSVGVVIVAPGAERPPNSIAVGGPLDEILMVERYIAGRELTCAVIGDFATDVIEIEPLKGLEFYDYEAKYAPGGSKHELPAQLLPEIYQSVRMLTPQGASGLGLPRRVARRLPLRRYAGWQRRADLPRSEYAAGHDGNVAGARARRLCRVAVRDTRQVDDRGRELQQVTAGSRFWWRALDAPTPSDPRDAAPSRPQPSRQAPVWHLPSRPRGEKDQAKKRLKLEIPQSDRRPQPRRQRAHRSVASLILMAGGTFALSALVAAITIGAGSIDKERFEVTVRTSAQDALLALGFGLDQVNLSGQNFTSDRDVFEALNLDRARTLASFDAPTRR